MVVGRLDALTQRWMRREREKICRGFRACHRGGGSPIARLRTPLRGSPRLAVPAEASRNAGAIPLLKLVPGPPSPSLRRAAFVRHCVARPGWPCQPEPPATRERRLVPGAGLEPARPLSQGILSPQRLPFRHPGVATITGEFPSAARKCEPTLHGDRNGTADGLARRSRIQSNRVETQSPQRLGSRSKRNASASVASFELCAL